MSHCDPIRDLLLDGTPLDANDAAHVASCEACAALSEALQRVTVEVESFEALVAPEALVAQTLERVQSLETEESPSVFGALLGQLGEGWMAMGKLVWMPFAALGRMRGPRLAVAIGAPALGVMLFVGTMTLGRVADSPAPFQSEVSALAGGDFPQTPPVSNRYGIEGTEEGQAGSHGESHDRIAQTAALGVLGYLDDGVANQPVRGEAGREAGQQAGRARRQAGRQGDDFLFQDTSRREPASGEEFDQSVARTFVPVDQPESEPVDESEHESEQETPAESPTPAFETTTSTFRVDALQEAENDRRGDLDGLRAGGDGTEDRAQDRLFPTSILEQVDGDEEEGRGWLGDDRANHWHRPDETVPSRIAVTNALGRDEVSGLAFRSPTGRWANTYVPGDPRWRLLGRRLRQHETVLAGVGVSAFDLAQQAQATAPRIAAPGQSALALSVQADRAQVEGQTRVLMQVGLRGAAVRGRRPTLRSVVLLDLRQPLDESQRASVRSLLASISRARTSADRIGIVVAGPHGGTLVEPGQLRLGEVTVALRRAFSNEGGEATTLEGALGAAIQSVSELSDADSPLGSGLVWLVTPGLDAARATSLESVAHTGALAGVTTTAIGLSAGVESDPLETVALAGHGRRWVVDGEPEQVVRREIQAASRVVARAVRLNVRLAPGTRLVNVLGSRPLSEIEAERSAAAERAVDQQLASRLGIAADRERDEDGIQIVVPAFYADDTHTILLDLVVEGPGPVADVSIRYKDLLRLDNGESNERLVLPRGRAERGPRQRDVLRSWLSHELSVSLRRAASQLTTSRPAALAELRRARARLQSARTSLRALASDRDLVRHAELCQRFEAALEGGAAPAVLADSLRFASRRLIFGDPLDSVGNPHGSPP